MSRDTEFDSGEYPMLPHRRGRPSKDQVDSFLSWAVRVVLVGMVTLGYHEAQQLQDAQAQAQTTLNTVNVTIAKISVVQDQQTKQLDQHTQEIQRLWQRGKDNGP